MKVDLHTKNLKISGDIAGYVNTRLQYALARFGHRIVAIRVLLADANGPRGGVDKLCRVRITGDRFEPVTIEVKDSQLRSAIDRGVERAARALTHAVERTKTLASSIASFRRHDRHRTA